jgi:hypothetical protein
MSTAAPKNNDAISSSSTDNNNDCISSSSIPSVSNSNTTDPTIPDYLKLSVAGWTGCPYFQRTWEAAHAASEKYPGKLLVIRVELSTRDSYHAWLAGIASLASEGSKQSPLTWLGDAEYFDGCDDALAYLARAFPFTPTVAPNIPEGLAARLAASPSCIRLFVAGDRSHCGKTTVCLGILGSLLKAGVPASHLAYIKPATQCEAPDVLANWCTKQGITHVAGSDAPLVFFKGFTRSVLEGTTPGGEALLAPIVKAIDTLALAKKFILIDGVGFPGVGSCVGASNADIAKVTPLRWLHSTEI